MKKRRWHLRDHFASRASTLSRGNSLEMGAPFPFGYTADPESTKGDPRPPIPDDREFPAVAELFRRALIGTETCQKLANWLNRQGFTTRNRKRTTFEEQSGEGAKPRRFTADSVRGIPASPFYAGFIVRERRSRRGTPSADRELRRGLHCAAVSEDEFNRVQSILRAHYRAPRRISPKFRPYLGKGLLRCYLCEEKAWCHHIKGVNCYQESSAFRGISCDAPGRYWPTPVIDRQIEQLAKPLELPQSWKERALQLSSAENNVLDLRLHRRSLDAHRRRIVELYKKGVIDRVEFDREFKIIDSQLRTIAPTDVALAEPSIADFERFGEIWDAATPEEKSELLGRIVESRHVDFKTG